MILAAILYGLKILGILIVIGLLAGLSRKGVRSYRSRSQQSDSTTSSATPAAGSSPTPAPWWLNNWLLAGVGLVAGLIAIALISTSEARSFAWGHIGFLMLELFLLLIFIWISWSNSKTASATARKWSRRFVVVLFIGVLTQFGREQVDEQVLAKDERDRNENDIVKIIAPVGSWSAPVKIESPPNKNYKRTFKIIPTGKVWLVINGVPGRFEVTPDKADFGPDPGNKSMRFMSQGNSPEDVLIPWEATPQ